MSAFAAHEQRILERMQLRGYSQRTQEAYLRELRKLTEYCGAAPDMLTGMEIRDYLLFLKTRTNLAPASLKMALQAIRFYLRKILVRPASDLPTVHRP